MDLSFLLDVALGHGTDLNIWSSKVWEQGEKPIEEASKSQTSINLQKYFNFSLCWGLPWWLSGKEPARQWRRREFGLWVRRIP